MEIIRKSHEELKAADIFLLTMNPNAQKMKHRVGSVIEIDKFVLYLDYDNAGEPDENGELPKHELLAIKDIGGEVFTTNSQTMIRDFFRMIDLFTSMGEVVHGIKIISGTSNKNREFITCTFDH